MGRKTGECHGDGESARAIGRADEEQLDSGSTGGLASSFTLRGVFRRQMENDWLYGKSKISFMPTRSIHPVRFRSITAAMLRRWMATSRPHSSFYEKARKAFDDSNAKRRTWRRKQLCRGQEAAYSRHGQRPPSRRRISWTNTVHSVTGKPVRLN
jgi:hypothetical protein